MPNKSAKYYMSKALTVIEAMRHDKIEEIRVREGGLGYGYQGRGKAIAEGQLDTLNQVKHILSDPEVLHAYFRMAVSNKPLSIPRHQDTVHELESMLANCEDGEMKTHIQIVIDRLKGD